MDRSIPDKLHIDQKEESCLCSQRWIMAFMGLLLGICMYTARVNMGIAIVCMVKRPIENTSEIYHQELWTLNTSSDGTALFSNWTETSNVQHVTDDTDSGQCRENLANANAEFGNAEFTWDKTTQSWILSAYYFGGLISQIPSGWVASRYGGKHVITVGTTISAALILLIPVCARLTPYLVIALRAGIGMAGCAMIPGWVDMVGKWAPPLERSRITATLWTGQIIGTILTYSTSGVLCSHGFDNGWGSIFYVHGGMMLVFLLPWLYFTASSPAVHPRVTDKEREYVEKFIKVVDSKDSIPWRSIFTSPPVWAVVIAFAGDTWLFFTILTCLPLFLKEVLKLDIERNGIYSSFPFVTMAVSLTVGSHLGDCLRARGLFSNVTTRRILQTVSFLGSAICIVVSGHMDCHHGNIVVIFICLCTFFTGIGEGGGYVPNAVEFAPRYAGLVMAVANTLGGISGILTPLVVGVLTQNGTTAEWQRVFYVCAGVAIVSSLSFLILSRGEVQSWAETPIFDMEVVICKPLTSKEQSNDTVPVTEKKCATKVDNEIDETTEELTLL